MNIYNQTCITYEPYTEKHMHSRTLFDNSTKKNVYREPIQLI
jgi:hypothetical protein